MLGDRRRPTSAVARAYHAPGRSRVLRVGYTRGLWQYARGGEMQRPDGLGSRGGAWRRLSRRRPSLWLTSRQYAGDRGAGADDGGA